jgi:hypothetical protein
LQQILAYLKKNPGERLDSEIAKVTGLSLKEVRQGVSQLALAGEVTTCSYVRFEDGKRIEGWLCRQAGYIPPNAPGRKPSKGR